MANYETTLKEAKAVGASQANDEQLMALFCDGPLQILCGAVSPKLVWYGAQAKKLTSKDLALLASMDAKAVEDLMWV